MKTRITDKHQDLQGQRSRSQGHMVRLRVVGCIMSRMKSLRNIKISYSYSYIFSFKVKMYKVKVTKPIIAEIKSVISSEREGLRTLNSVHSQHRWSTKIRFTDKCHDLQGKRSRSQGHVVSLGRERKVLVKPKLMGWFKHSKSHQFQGQKVKSQGHQDDYCC